MNIGSVAERLLLISNSTLYGSGYLDHAESEIRDFLGGTACVAFIPFAMYDWKAYTTKTQELFRAMGYQLASVHDISNARRRSSERDLRGRWQYVPSLEGAV